MLELCVDFLQKAHELDLPYSVRDGINALRYTLKLRHQDKTVSSDQIFNKAITQILVEEALDLESLAERKRLSGEQLHSMNLGDFFFSDDNTLNPDTDEDL